MTKKKTFLPKQQDVGRSGGQENRCTPHEPFAGNGVRTGAATGANHRWSILFSWQDIPSAVFRNDGNLHMVSFENIRDVPLVSLDALSASDVSER